MTEVERASSSAAVGGLPRARRRLGRYGGGAAPIRFAARTAAPARAHQGFPVRATLVCPVGRRPWITPRRAGGPSLDGAEWLIAEQDEHQGSALDDARRSRGGHNDAGKVAEGRPSWVRRHQARIVENAGAFDSTTSSPARSRPAAGDGARQGPASRGSRRRRADRRSGRSPHPQLSRRHSCTRPSRFDRRARAGKQRIHRRSVRDRRGARRSTLAQKGAGLGCASVRADIFLGSGLPGRAQRDDEGEIGQRSGPRATMLVGGQTTWHRNPTSLHRRRGPSSSTWPLVHDPRSHAARPISAYAGSKPRAVRAPTRSEDRAAQAPAGHGHDAHEPVRRCSSPTHEGNLVASFAAARQYICRCRALRSEASCCCPTERLRRLDRLKALFLGASAGGRAHASRGGAEARGIGCTTWQSHRRRQPTALRRARRATSVDVAAASCVTRRGADRRGSHRASPSRSRSARRQPGLNKLGSGTK